MMYADAGSGTSYRERLSWPVLKFLACEKYSPHAVQHVPIEDRDGVWLPRAQIIAGWAHTDEEKERFKELVKDQIGCAIALQERAQTGYNPWDKLEFTVTEKCRVMALKTPRLIFAAEDVTRGDGTLVWPVSAQ